MILIIFSSSYFLGIFWLIVTHDFINWEDNQTLDVYYGYKTFYNSTDSVHNFANPNLSNIGILVRYWYFALTTLASIGFGDFHANSPPEKIVMLIILNFGVAIFAFLMSEFVEILLARSKLETSTG